MRILFLGINDWEQKYLENKLPGHSLAFAKAEDSGSFENVGAISNFIDLPLTFEYLNKFPNLKYIATRSTGYDHIDLKACKEKGVAVSNVPTYGENTVAEFTFALILALSRKIYPAIKKVKEEGAFSQDGLEGSDLKGKILGVVGTGHIGERVVKIAKGFEMQVLAYDHRAEKDLGEGVSYTNLDDLLSRSDIITLHVPYSKETHHLINAEKLKLFKKEALLINTARGGVVNTQALLFALKQGALGWAALDVLEEEGYVKDEHDLLFKHPNKEQLETILADYELAKMDNVIITPHNAFNTKEAVERILDTTVENLKSFAEGKPQNLVK